MVINYRDHRGSLADSLSTSRQYDSLKALHDDIGFDSIDYYGYDERCKQHLFIVKQNTVRSNFLSLELMPIPIGFIFESATKYPSEEEFERRANKLFEGYGHED